MLSTNLVPSLACSPCLGEVGQGQGQWSHHPAMPPPSPPSLLSLGTTSPHQVQLQKQQSKFNGHLFAHRDINNPINTENT